MSTTGFEPVREAADEVYVSHLPLRGLLFQELLMKR
jgi:hypothetical protein